MLTARPKRQLAPEQMEAARARAAHARACRKPKPEKPPRAQAPPAALAEFRFEDYHPDALAVYIYALFAGDVLRYIGQTRQPAGRFNAHRAAYAAQGVEITRVLVMLVHAEDANRTERAFIRVFQPPDNTNARTAATEADHDWLTNFITHPTWMQMPGLRWRPPRRHR